MTMAAPGSTVEGVPIDWAQRRELFPLDPHVAYLNHGAFGVVPIPVRRAQQRLRDEMDANPMAFFNRGLIDRLSHTRTHLAAFLGADPAGAALTANATAAANAVLRSVPLGAGQEILLTDHGYGAVANAAREVAGRCGATVRDVAVPLTADDDDIIARVVDAVRPGHTRLVVVDQVTSPTAKLFPAGRLAAELRARGVPVLIDGAHVPGMLAVDVSAIGADFWLGNLHKWAFTPRPTALLAVAPEHRAGMRAPVVSWEQASGYPVAHEFAGTLDYTAWLAAPAGVHLLRTLGPDRVRTHNTDLAANAQRLIADTLAEHWPSGGQRTDLLELARAGLLGSQAVSMRLVPLPPGIADDPDAARDLRDRLALEHRIEVPINTWNGIGLLRLCAQIYNQLDDYDRLADALRQILRPR
jgi:isopenicillin-N epimerase